MSAVNAGIKTTYYKYDRRGHKVEHWTRGEFLGWQKGGEFGLWYAIFKLKASTMAIPRHLLTAESKAALPSPPIAAA